MTDEESLTSGFGQPIDELREAIWVELGESLDLAMDEGSIGSRDHKFAEDSVRDLLEDATTIEELEEACNEAFKRFPILDRSAEAIAALVRDALGIDLSPHVEAQQEGGEDPHVLGHAPRIAMDHVSTRQAPPPGVQTWDYKEVYVTVQDIGDMLKHRKKRHLLDPELSASDWKEMTWRDSRQDLGRVAWSDRGCWTAYSLCLQELGEQGWELVAISPAFVQWFAAGNVNRTDHRYSSFSLTLKRPRSQDGGT